MRHEPDNLPRHVLLEALNALWALDVSNLAYAPLGFGSHHWVAECGDGSRRFVTADDLVNTATQDGDTVQEHFDGLRAAFETACRLRDAGLEFVLAPERTRKGEAIGRVGENWSLAVFPFVDGAPVGPGAWDGVPGATEAAGLIGRLHGATPPESIRRWRAEIPHRRVLEEALAHLERPWHSGPFGERTRALLTSYRGALEKGFEAYDGLASEAIAAPEAWVVTHGEPHSANFVRTATGDILLIDWDTVRLAPRERDLELGEGLAFEAYAGASGQPQVRNEVRRLFTLRWSLADVCEFVRLFRGEHGESEDEVASWGYLNSELARLLPAAG